MESFEFIQLETRYQSRWIFFYWAVEIFSSFDFGSKNQLTWLGVWSMIVERPDTNLISSSEDVSEAF